MRQHTATFANFICRFGDKVLLDYAEEVVIPAFTRDTYVRSYGKKTHYHFYEVEFLNIAESGQKPILVLAGRFIKDTELTRHQIFDEKKGLVRDEQSMRSAPSAFFILLLNNHRLIYFPETPHAPDLASFKATAQNFLSRRHKEFLEQLYDESREFEQPPTKKALAEAHPWPHLEIIQLTGKASVADFLKRFGKLSRIDFRVVRPNDDINAGEILGQVRELSDEVGSTNTKLTVANKDGLDIPASTEALQEATATGNQDVQISGYDEAGNRLTGNNDSFKLMAAVENIPPSKRGLINRLVGMFIELNQTNAIIAPPADQQNAKTTDLSGKV